MKEKNDTEIIIDLLEHIKEKDDDLDYRRAYLDIEGLNIDDKYKYAIVSELNKVIYNSALEEEKFDVDKLLKVITENIAKSNFTELNKTTKDEIKEQVKSELSNYIQTDTLQQLKSFIVETVTKNIIDVKTDLMNQSSINKKEKKEELENVLVPEEPEEEEPEEELEEEDLVSI